MMAARHVEGNHGLGAWIGNVPEPADSEEGDGAPQHHSLPTHGVGRFLLECPPDTPVRELGSAYQRWRATGDTEQSDAEQTDATGWSE